MDLRTSILAEHMDRDYRIVDILDPPRDRTPSDYTGVVDDWHDRRAQVFEEKFAAEDGVGAILVWGDPSLYDSTLRIVERVLARGNVAFDYTVIPASRASRRSPRSTGSCSTGSASRCTSPPVGSCATAYRSASARPS